MILFVFQYWQIYKLKMEIGERIVNIKVINDQVIKLTHLISLVNFTFSALNPTSINYAIHSFYN